MATYVNQPYIDIKYLRPLRATFDVVGASFDGGVDGNGVSISAETAGGGRVVCSYENCMLEYDDTRRHEVINWLGARGNGSHRFFVVPLIMPGIGPFPIENGVRAPTLTGITHSDGALFSDGSGYSQPSVYGEVTSPAKLNAGTIRVRVSGAVRPLRHSDWFSIYHPTKGWRAYRYWDIISKTDAANPVYELAISPALREAVAPGTVVEFAIPRCVMKFPRGFTVPFDYSGWYSSRPTLQFEEAF